MDDLKTFGVKRLYDGLDMGDEKDYGTEIINGFGHV